MKKKSAGKPGLDKKKVGPDSGVQESGVKKKRKVKPTAKNAMNK